MATVLNQTGYSAESIRRNPAAVLGRDSPFFGPDASTWAAEIFLPVGGGVALPMTTLLGCYSGPRAACGLGLVEPKAKERSICISLLRLPFLQSLLFVFPPRKIRKQRLAWFVVSRFPTNTLALDGSFKELPPTFLWLPNEGHEMIGLHRRSHHIPDMGRAPIISDCTPCNGRSRNLENPSWVPVGFVSGPVLPPEGINATPSPLAGQAASLADKVLVILGTKDEGRRLPTSAGYMLVSRQRSTTLSSFYFE